MIDQLKRLRDRIDQALALLEPLAPVFAAWRPAQEPVERHEDAPGTPRGRQRLLGAW